MKGHMEDGKFHPHTQHNGVRKSRDQNTKHEGVKIRKARENFAELLRNNLKTFNEHHSPKLEYGDVGGQSKGLKIAGTNSFIVSKMSREQALDCVLVLNRYLNEGGSRKKRAIDEETNLDMKVKKIEGSLKEGLEEHFKNNPKFKNAVWDVDIVYTGSHGTVDSEYFTITAFRKGVGSVEYQEAFSNDDWFDTSDSKLVKKIENDQEFAQKEYDKWLISVLDIYEDAMFEGLVATIESEYA